MFYLYGNQWPEMRNNAFPTRHLRISSTLLIFERSYWLDPPVLLHFTSYIPLVYEFVPNLYCELLSSGVAGVCVLELQLHWTEGCLGATVWLPAPIIPPFAPHSCHSCLLQKNARISLTPLQPAQVGIIVGIVCSGSSATLMVCFFPSAHSSWEHML